MSGLGDVRPMRCQAYGMSGLGDVRSRRRQGQEMERALVT